MNTFNKEWLTSTLAPEAIKTFSTKDGVYIDLVANEDRTITVAVISTNIRVLGIGKTLEELANSSPYSFIDAVKKVAELLQLQSISTS